MNIWIDINHIAQYCFYKQFILRVASEGHTVFLTVLNRGRLLDVVHTELENVKGVSIFGIGKHKLTKFSAIVDANLRRLPQLWLWARKQKIDIAFSNGMQLAIVSHWLKIPNYSFDDDPQTLDFRPKVAFNTICHFCVYEDPAILPPVKVLRCTKEWASLSPKYFSANPSSLSKYGVKPKQYIFVREVSVGTINYAAQSKGTILSCKDQLQQLRYRDEDGQACPMKVIFSLEQKQDRSAYPPDWILLEEPVEDIHSLIYYSAGLVSSGDSMAREAALLGVPSYYLGIRYDMPANKAVSKVANLQTQKTMPFEDWCKSINMPSQANAEQLQVAVRETIDKAFIDVNQYMHDLLQVPLDKKNRI